MKLQRFIPILVLAILVMAPGCKKESTSTPTYTQPTIASHTEIEVPAGLTAQANSGDYNAAYAATFMGLANGLGSFANSFTVPEGATKQSLKSNGVVYFWTYSGYSYWMTYKALASKYTWTYDYETPQLSRFTFISAEELRTGAGGNWKIYDPEASSNVMWDYTWTLVNSVYNATMNLYGEENTMRFVVLDNGNNSGNFKYFDGEVKMVDITWNSDGSGTWWMTDGEAEYSGEWTATGK